MKLKNLIEKIDNQSIIFISGKQYEGNLPTDILEKEIIKINIEIGNEKQDLESLGYNFEVGV